MLSAEVLGGNSVGVGVSVSASVFQRAGLCRMGEQVLTARKKNGHIPHDQNVPVRGTF